MAITITTRAGSEQDVYNRSCIGHLTQLEYDVTFSSTVVGQMINVNLWMWGDATEVQYSVPLFYNLTADPIIGYNIVPTGTGSFIEMVLAGSYTGRETWKNVKVFIRFTAATTAIIRVQFMHTINQKWWIRQTTPQSNFKRMFYSHVNEPLEYDIRPESMYDRDFSQSYMGIAVQRYTPSATPPFKWEIVDEKIYAEYRAFAWWWNQINTDPLDVTDTPVLTYEWAFSRNSIPVATLSTTEDTDVVFTISVLEDVTFEAEYYVLLIKIDPIADNVDEFWEELPMAEGEVTGVNTFGGAVSFFPYQLNSAAIVGDCSVFAETGVDTDIWQSSFTIPKEVIDPGCTYRLGIILKHEFTGPPV